MFVVCMKSTFFKAHFCLSMPWRYRVKNDRRPEIGLAKLPTAMFATTKYTCFGGRFLQHSNSILALYNYTLLLKEEKLVHWEGYDIHQKYLELSMSNF